MRKHYRSTTSQPATPGDLQHIFSNADTVFKTEGCQISCIGSVILLKYTEKLVLVSLPNRQKGAASELFVFL